MPGTLVQRAWPEASSGQVRYLCWRTACTWITCSPESAGVSSWLGLSRGEACTRCTGLKCVDRASSMLACRSLLFRSQSWLRVIWRPLCFRNCEHNGRGASKNAIGALIVRQVRGAAASCGFGRLERNKNGGAGCPSRLPRYLCEVCSIWADLKTSCIPSVSAV